MQKQNNPIAPAQKRRNCSGRITTEDQNQTPLVILSAVFGRKAKIYGEGSCVSQENVSCGISSALRIQALKCIQMFLTPMSNKVQPRTQ